jgi:hypothetical protein
MLKNSTARWVAVTRDEPVAMRATPADVVGGAGCFGTVVPDEPSRGALSDDEADANVVMMMVVMLDRPASTATSLGRVREKICKRGEKFTLRHFSR